MGTHLLFDKQHQRAVILVVDYLSLSFNKDSPPQKNTFCLRAFSASDGKVLLLPVETGESEISYLWKFKPAMQTKHKWIGGGCLVAITDDMMKF